mmetsp:Transcript_86931/g.150045  ORF Transcript_86931/g.150045 Transcript_86931/m.150045 type:complete len:197 (+) Transcript_86931:528-1118(+)
MCAGSKASWDHECPSASDNYHFIVLDYAGEEGIEWYQRTFKLVNLDVFRTAVAEVLNQVRDGLTYLSSLNPAWIHHDLKWENIAVKDNGGKVEVRLIDFGAAMMVTSPIPRNGSVSTRHIAPPEWNNPRAYALPGYSFDAYSLGCMAADALCPLLNGRDIQACADRVEPLLKNDPKQRVKPSTVQFWSKGMELLSA